MHSTRFADTENLAKQIGQNLRGGEVVDLVSDLGGGKTTFVRGLARGIGSKDTVTSPTYTISNVYDSPNFRLYHFDFYRLVDPGLQSYELAEAIADKQAVVVTEWSSLVNKLLPQDRLKIAIKVMGQDSREITFMYPDSLNYSVKGLST